MTQFDKKKKKNTTYLVLLVQIFIAKNEKNNSYLNWSGDDTNCHKYGTNNE